jgi:hypothetical protein
VRRPLVVLSLVGALLTGIGGVEAAQSEPSPLEVASVRVVATIVDGTTLCPDDVGDRLDPVTASPGRRVSCVQASDPRISGRIVMDTQGLGGGMWNASVILQNGAGDWRGTASGYRDPEGTAVAWMILGGLGAFAGSTAMLRIEDGRAVGLIAPAELPGLPSPVDPARPRSSPA